MQKAAPNIQLCVSKVLTAIEAISTQIGGTARVLVDPAVSLSVLLK
jgi:hypothetical protein